MTSRRRFIATTTAAILAAPLSAEAQQVERVYRVGVLLTELSAAVTSHLQAFRERLRELGYVEGQNLVVDVKSLTDPAGGRDGLATELVRWRTDVIVAWGTPATLVAKQATTTIPIIMVSVADPVGPGLVATLSRPGANITGISNLSRELSGKQLELLRELRPRVNRFAVLRNVGNPASAFQWRETETAARAVGVKLQLVEVGQAKELEGAVATMVRERVIGVLFLSDALWVAERRQLAELALKARLATVFTRSENVEAGGLVSYGPSLVDQFRQAAVYVDKVLKGTKPADIPVEQPTKFELVIINNMKTAKTLGLTIPQSLLLRADEVIE